MTYHIVYAFFYKSSVVVTIDMNTNDTVSTTTLKYIYTLYTSVLTQSDKQCKLTLAKLS